MNCPEFEHHLHPYVDGELEVSETLAAEAHAAECAACRGLVERERRFRQLLRAQQIHLVTWRQIDSALAMPAK